MARQSHPPRRRGSGVFSKPPLAHDDLADRWVERGLVIPDRERALRYLRHLGYYRLSPYTIPFQQDRAEHRFQPGTSFDQVLDLYVFDRQLRLLCLDAVERVEVAIRAALTDHMSTAYDDAHWYTRREHFADLRRHADLLKSVRTTVSKQLARTPENNEGSLHHRSALEHYLVTYGDPELPPSWLTVESLTIGQLDGLYQNLARRSDRTAIAQSVGLTEPILRSWLQVYVRVRNVCAHHGRLWNVGLGVYPKIPESPKISWFDDPAAVPTASERRLYPVLASLQSVLDTVSPHSRWAQRLHQLLEGRPAMNLRGMGVPEDWASQRFWHRHF